MKKRVVISTIVLVGVICACSKPYVTKRVDPEDIEKRVCFTHKSESNGETQEEEIISVTEQNMTQVSTEEAFSPISVEEESTQETETEAENLSEKVEKETENEIKLMYETNYALTQNISGSIKLFGKDDQEYFNEIHYVEIKLNNGKEIAFSTQAAVQDYWDGCIDEIATECIEKNGGLELVDFNFDGYTDIGLQVHVPAYNTPYIYWMFNPESQEYDYYGYFAGNLQVNTEEGYCVVYSHDVNEYYTDFYEVDSNNWLYLSRRETEIYENDKNKINKTEKLAPDLYNQVYRDLLQKMLDTKKIPGTEMIIAGGIDAVIKPNFIYYCKKDIDSDGEDELLLNLSYNCSGAGVVLIYKYDETTKNISIEKMMADQTEYENWCKELQEKQGKYLRWSLIQVEEQHDTDHTATQNA